MIAIYVVLFLFVYLCGVAITYIVTKKITKKIDPFYERTDEFFSIYVPTTLSFAGLLIFFVAIAFGIVADYLDKKFNL